MNNTQQELNENAAIIAKEYTEVRAKLTTSEQAIFDKVVAFLPSLSTANDSTRVKTLDMCLTLGLTTVALHPLALMKLNSELLGLLGTILKFDSYLKSNPQFNQ